MSFDFTNVTKSPEFQGYLPVLNKHLFNCNSSAVDIRRGALKLKTQIDMLKIEIPLLEKKKNKMKKQ